MAHFFLINFLVATMFIQGTSSSLSIGLGKHKLFFAYLGTSFSNFRHVLKFLKESDCDQRR